MFVSLQQIEEKTLLHGHQQVGSIGSIAKSPAFAASESDFTSDGHVVGGTVQPIGLPVAFTFSILIILAVVSALRSHEDTPIQSRKNQAAQQTALDERE